MNASDRIGGSRRYEFRQDSLAAYAQRAQSDLKQAGRFCMKTFVLVTKLASHDAPITEIGAKLSDRSRTGRAWLNEIKEKCPEVKFKVHYALMGYWDSMHIYEAPDEESAAKVSLLTRPYAAQVESWLALPYEKIMKMTEEMDSSGEDT
jgi:uncharacterized protein with GYD domain